jgi:hypothetical protein
MDSFLPRHTQEVSGAVISPQERPPLQTPPGYLQEYLNLRRSSVPLAHPNSSLTSMLQASPNGRRGHGNQYLSVRRPRISDCTRLLTALYIIKHCDAAFRHLVMLIVCLYCQRIAAFWRFSTGEFGRSSN